MNLFQNLVKIEVEAKFPRSTRGRPPKISVDDAYHWIEYIARTGIQWRALPVTQCSYTNVFRIMQEWIRAGVFKTAYRRLLRLYSRRRRPKYYCIDGSFVKNVYGRDCVGRNPTDRGRKATKVTAIVDDLGIPFSILMTPANQADVVLLESTIKAAVCPLRRHTPMMADRGYDSRRNRRCLQQSGLLDRIFRRKTKTTRRSNARRGVVERFFAWNDKWRRLVLRYDSFISTYTGLTFLFCGTLLARRMRGMDVNWRDIE